MRISHKENAQTEGEGALRDSCRRELLSVSHDAIDSTKRDRQRAHKPTPPRHRGGSCLACRRRRCPTPRSRTFRSPTTIRHPRPARPTWPIELPHIWKRPDLVSPSFHQLIHALDDGSVCLGASLAAQSLPPASSIRYLFVRYSRISGRFRGSSWPGWLFLGGEFRHFGRIGASFGQ